MFKLVQDDIADDVVQWVTARPELGQPLDSPGSMQPVMDPLAMRDAVVNRLWAGFTGKTYKGINRRGQVHPRVHSAARRQCPRPRPVARSPATRGGWG